MEIVATVGITSIINVVIVTLFSIRPKAVLILWYTVDILSQSVVCLKGCLGTRICRLWVRFRLPDRPDR